MSVEPTIRASRRSRARPTAARDAAQDSAGATAPSPRVTIVVPTLNEATTIERLIDRVGAAMGPASDAPPFELIVVDDDSPDETWRIAQDRADRDARIRVIRRVGPRGLSSAVLAGMAMARGNVLVVIDADLQHDERCIPRLVAAIDAGADVALGSREVDGGGYGPFGRWRLGVSRLGAALARRAVGVEVSDPMSGFFAVSRDRYGELAGQLNPRGFKILLEFLARGPEPEVAEIGYVFGRRAGGTTKFTGGVGAAFVVSVIELTVARRLGRRRRAWPAGR